MSFMVTLEVLGATQDELKAFGAKLPQAGKLKMKPVKDGLMFWKWKGFEIEGVSEGLASQPTAKNENWQLNAETRASLRELLAAWAKGCPRIFSIYAAEKGELPKRESELQLAELLELVETGALGNRVHYRVRELPPKILEEEASAPSGSTT